MGIFSVDNYFQEDANVELPLDVEVIEKDDVEYASEVPAENEDPLAVAGEVAAQTESNWNSLMMSIGMHELRYLKENGTEIIYEAVDIKAFKDKVVQFFKTLKDKIWSVVKNFVATFQSRVMKGEKFINKYSSEIKNGFNKLKDKKSDKKIKIYEFTDKVKSWTPDDAWKAMGCESIQSKLDSASSSSAYNSIIEKEDRTATEMASKVLGTSVTADNYDKEVFKFFYGGDYEKKEKKIIDLDGIEKYMDVVRSGKSLKTVKENYKKFEKNINSIIKKAKGIKEFNVEGKSGENNQNYMNRLQADIAYLKTAMNVTNKVYHGQLSAIKAQYKQARSICLACVYGENKVDKKLFGESHSFLSDVEFA